MQTTKNLVIYEQMRHIDMIIILFSIIYSSGPSHYHMFRSSIRKFCVRMPKAENIVVHNHTEVTNGIKEWAQVYEFNEDIKPCSEG